MLVCVLGSVLVLGTLVTACSTDSDDPPGIDGPAVVDTSVDVDPTPDTTPVTTPDGQSTPTTAGLIDSIDGPVVVGSTP